MMKFDHLALPVSNLDRSRDWYIATLGLKVEFEIPARHAVALQDGEGFAIFLEERAGVVPNGIALWFQVDDVDKTFGEWTARGVVFAHAAAEEFLGIRPRARRSRRLHRAPVGRAHDEGEVGRCNRSVTCRPHNVGMVSSSPLSRRESLRRAALFLAFAGAPATASAQQGAYPAKPVKLVIPYPPGGGTDITGRAMAQKLSEFLGQSVVIENKPGATGMIGAASVAKSAPDGYTVLFGAASEMAINASLFKNMTYDPRTDFEPVTLVATFPLVFIAPATTNQSLKELIEAARVRPDSVSYGSIGSGSPQHLAAELLSSMAKARFLHIPYKGSGPLVQDAVGGHVDMAVSSVPPAVPLVRAGKLRALAVTSSARSEALPDVPTMAELGFPVTSSTPGSASPCRRARRRRSSTDCAMAWSPPSAPARCRPRCATREPSRPARPPSNSVSSCTTRSPRATA